jgi:hypothetical protein
MPCAEEELLEEQILAELVPRAADLAMVTLIAVAMRYP